LTIGRPLPPHRLSNAGLFELADSSDDIDVASTRCAEGAGVNEPLEVPSAPAQIAHDAQPRLRALALTADVAPALRILDRLDAAGSSADSVIESPKR
jgi:hypothetical protein